MAVIMIVVGRMTVAFSCLADERIREDQASGAWYAEYEMRENGGTREAPSYGRHWVKLGTYNSEADAARALYVERREFSASYGCDYAAGID